MNTEVCTSDSGLTNKRKSSMVKKLLNWGSQNSFDYPWRKTCDPYQTMIAEMLLRKTQANQVVDVYEKFLEHFPTLEALSKSRVREIAAIIKPLGLKSRSQWMKDIACELKRTMGSKITDGAELESVLRNRPYMLNAIRCFAYDLDVPVFDVNVRRILQRVFSIQFDRDSHRKKSSWDLASALVPHGKAKLYNWTLLDLGKTICTARIPKCDKCPLMKICDFAVNGRPST